MNRRRLLRGLLALPFVGVAVKHAPESWGWMGAQPSGDLVRTASLGGGELWPGTYKVSEISYGGTRTYRRDFVATLNEGDTIAFQFVHTHGNPDADANHARFFEA